MVPSEERNDDNRCGVNNRASGKVRSRRKARTHAQIVSELGSWVDDCGQHASATMPRFPAGEEGSRLLVGWYARVYRMVEADPAHAAQAASRYRPARTNGL